MPETAQASGHVLSWLHFGDLHVTGADAQNYADLQALIDAANRHVAAGADFAVLPGDNADSGSDDEYRLVRSAFAKLRLTLHILPGDHDFHTGSLRGFHEVLGAAALPQAVRVPGHRCLFLDIVSAGTGGPDFRLQAPHLSWLEAQLREADAVGERCVVFMHSYPADLTEGRDALVTLLARYRVACVDIGHTHYNELANDGRTIFAATRSTGQIEEGPVGFSVAAVCDGGVSWRFQELQGGWPLVLIVSPVDHRLITDADSPRQVVRGTVPVQAKLFGAVPIGRAEACIDDGPAFPLHADPSQPALWGATVETRLADGLHSLTVRARDRDGAAGTETIRFACGRHAAPTRHADGSDADALPAWPEKGIPGGQLGPNRNGRKW